MTSENDSLHVIQMNDRWIVEKDNGTSVAEAPDQAGAVELAQESAQAEGASEIAIHSADGQVEKTIKVGEPTAE